MVFSGLGTRYAHSLGGFDGVRCWRCRLGSASRLFQQVRTKLGTGVAWFVVAGCCRDVADYSLTLRFRRAFRTGAFHRNSCCVRCLFLSLSQELRHGYPMEQHPVLCPLLREDTPAGKHMRIPLQAARELALPRAQKRLQDNMEENRCQGVQQALLPGID